MECIDTKTYVCRLCGFITDRKPYTFPDCPACQCEQVEYSGNTKEVSDEKTRERKYK